MHLICVGCSHHTAPVSVRELVAFPAGHVRDALQSARRVPGVREAAILSTCNRTEIYAVCETPDHGPLADFLCRHAHEDLRAHLYSYTGEAAPRHLFRVAGGADSMVVGEGQILGQVREAARLAVEESSAGPVMRRMFDFATQCGRRVRNETEIGRGAVSVSHMAVELARQIFGELRGQSVLLLGAGETAEMTARQMAKHGVPVLMVANRTFERAEALAQSLGGQAVKYDEFPDRLAKADIVVSSTAAPHAIIGQEVVRAAAARRRGRPMFFIDLAVPRDVEPSVGDLDNVFLYNLDDLQEMVSRNLQGRRTELDTVTQIIAEEAAGFMRWLASLDAVPVLNELQHRFEAIRQSEWERTERRLANLSPAERDAVEQMTRAMMKKALHEPWRYLKGNAQDASAIASLQAVRDVFGLEESSEFHVPGSVLPSPRDTPHPLAPSPPRGEGEPEPPPTPPSEGGGPDVHAASLLHEYPAPPPPGEDGRGQIWKGGASQAGVALPLPLPGGGGPDAHAASPRHETPAPLLPKEGLGEVPAPLSPWERGAGGEGYPSDSAPNTQHPTPSEAVA